MFGGEERSWLGGADHSRKASWLWLHLTPSASVQVGLVAASMKYDTCQIPLGLGKIRNKINGAPALVPGPHYQDALT